MKKVICVLGFVYFLSAASCSVNAQWTASTGLDGGYCMGAGILDSTLFVTAEGNGVFFRKINSNIWDQALSPAGFTEVVVTGEALFIWGPGGYCYRSLDYGLTWHEFDTISGQLIYSMVSADTILFYTEGSVIYRSDDLGNSHYSISNSLPWLDYPIVYYSNGMLFCSDSYPSMELYSSPDLGNTWNSLTLLGLTPGTYAVNLLAKNNDRIWLSVDSGLYYIDNSSGSWVQYSDSLLLRKMETINGTFYATSMENGFLRFDPQSQQWIPENTGLETFEAWGFCALDSVLYLSTAVGPYKAESLYEWEPYYDNMNGLEISCPQAGDDKVWVSSRRHFYSSVDNGVSFSIVDWNLSGNNYQGIFTDSCYYVIAGDSLFISYDKGISWSKKTEGLPYTNPYPFLALQCLGINSDYLFLGTNYGLFRAKFPDLAWEHLTSLYANGRNRIDKMVVNDSIILLDKEFYITYYYYNFRSENNGDSFDSLTMFSPHDYTYFARDGDSFYATNLSQLYKSLDEGNSWSPIPVPENLRYLVMAAKDPAIVLSCTYFETNLLIVYPEVLITYDYGTTWNDIWDNLPPIYYFGVVPTSILEDRLFAASTLHGIWYRDDLLTGSDGKLIKANPVLELFPNPSDGRFDVRINHLERGAYTLRVFNSMGKMIRSKTLDHPFDGPLNISMHLTDMPAGLYHVSFSTPGKTYSQKLMIR